MQLKDEAILLSSKKLLENQIIVTALTRQHGVYSGFLQNRTKKGQNISQAGNLVDFSWSARLEEHLGRARCEVIKCYSAAGLLGNRNLLALSAILELTKFCLHERHPYPEFYDKLLNFLNALLQRKLVWRDYFLLEIKLLQVSGYALDLSMCPVMENAEDLCYVSPKTGRSISRKAGEEYKDKLLPLPQFLLDKTIIANIDEIKQAASLCEYFLMRWIYKEKNLPTPRKLLIQSIY